MAGAAAATHPSRQMEDFTLVLAMAFLQYSIWGQAQGRCWGAWQLVPPRSCPHPLPHSPLSCSNPCSWSARDTRGWVRHGGAGTLSCHNHPGQSRHPVPHPGAL